MEPDDKILSRIKKLKALLSSSNPNEVNAAIKRINTLMQQHELTNKDVELSDISEEKAEWSPSKSKKMPKYLAYLVTAICKNFIVKSIRYADGRTSFIGTGERPAIAAYVYSVLARQLITARKEYIDTLHGNTSKSNKTRYADSFAEGWTSEVYNKIVDFSDENEVSKINEWIAHKFGKLEASKVRNVNEGSKRIENNKALHEYAGRLSAKNVVLNHGVDGTETALLNE
ncbi:TPA: DUF2786 domain-containing protein [Yersinia enterocolitica]|nr:DUF2786 domain-containing protein [Yersinia enterocolitica]HDL6901011.1 DUF2786 domain-containing protein [Yersinia enterocolitica]HDL7092117.1 DUF2786 domain-containing protein [Yersinia enterocolitica]HDL7101155.1 DUF2786 domain-containing protein [Yersinia enterocolitica]HDL7135636.1 DUF2786 domain-containing protein [Yersinia enterocolitica]